MGLFDGYGLAESGGGSLIDRLMAQLGAQGQSQQNSFSGLPSDQAQYQQPANAMAQMPAQLQPAQVSPLDNAQWPAGPMGAPLQANAQQQSNPNYPYSTPQQGAPQPPQALPAFFGEPPAPQGPGFGDRMLATMQSVGHSGGLLQSLANGATAFSTGQRADAQGLQQQTLRAQYEALRPILGDQKALLAAINPEAGKALIAEALGPKTLTPLGEGYVADKQGNVRRAYEPGEKNKVVQTGQDGLGRQTYSVFNPSDGSIKPVAAPAGNDSGGGLGNMDLTGKEYLASIPTAQRGTVQGMVEGTIAPPSSFALSKPYWQNMIAAAKIVDPTFDATNWSGRVAGVKDFSAGKSAEMVRSANQTLHHVGALIDSMDGLNNGTYPLLNKIGNAAAEASGGGAQGAFRSNAHAVATELSKVFKGSNLSDAEVHAWEQNLHENMSPEQQRTQVAKLGELLHGSLQALEEKRLNSIGPAAAEKQGPLIRDEGQRVLSRIQDWIAKGSGKAAASPGPLSAGETTKVGNVTIRRVN